MSAPAKTRLSPGVRTLLIIAAAVLLLSGVFVSLYRLRRIQTFDEDSGQRPVVASTPATSSLLNKDAEATSSSTNRESQNEQIPEGDLLRGLSGEYTGTIALPEADILGETNFSVSKERFILRPKQGRPLSGHLTAKNMREYVELELIFDEPVARVPGFSKLSSMTARATYNLAELPSLSLRATLPSSGNGWVIKNAPDEKHEVLFISTNCPDYPYCKPVRRCRPCEPG